MTSTISSRVFYHIYPLGMCGAPARNDFASPPGSGLKQLADRIPHLQSLGVNAVYLGPLFESAAHGYDTVDYWHVDRRLGTDADLAALVRSFHDAGIAVVLDAVLNHTGRDFFAFRDLREKGPESAYRGWYKGVDFSRRSPAGDSFMYEGWSGHYDLAKLETADSGVREHLFGAVRHWIEDFHIDGLRLDAADVLSPDFMDALSIFCKSIKPDFWLMGEVVHGDYTHWARAGRLDSVTNYELYKGLWSSLNDRNFFELAWSLNRQSGSEGLYKDLKLYTFVDNHDVPRAASVLNRPADLPLLYSLLFTVPGIPSVYYGSEWGIRGAKQPGSDADLRPAIAETAEQGKYARLPPHLKPKISALSLENTLRQLSALRKSNAALRDGDYRQLHVSSTLLAFERIFKGEKTPNDQSYAAVAANADDSTANVSIRAESLGHGRRFVDALDRSAGFTSEHGSLAVQIPARTLRVLVPAD